jgi:hypothetical protein
MILSLQGKTAIERNCSFFCRTNSAWYSVNLNRNTIRDAPDTVFAGYPANPKAGYRISGKSRIPDIRPDTWLEN